MRQPLLALLVVCITALAGATALAAPIKMSGALTAAPGTGANYPLRVGESDDVSDLLPYPGKWIELGWD